MTKDLINVGLMLALVGTLAMWLHDAKRMSYLEGKEAVFASMTSGDEHVCGPYEQPVHPNFRKDKKK